MDSFFRFIFLCQLLVIILLNSFCTEPEIVNININAGPFKDHYITLGYYHGIKTYFKDSIYINNTGYADYRTTLHDGLYFIVLPDSSVHEIMISEASEYSVQVMQERLKSSIIISGSISAEAYNNYLHEAEKIYTEIDSLKKAVIEKTVKGSEKSRIFKEVKILESNVDKLKNRYALKYKGTLAGNYLQSQISVAVPGFEEYHDSESYDSIKWFLSLNYYKENYLKNIIWEDERLIYTPVIDQKTNMYLNRIVRQNTIEITQAIDNILSNIKNQEMKKYVLKLLTDKYYSDKHTPLSEYAYIYLIKNYYFTGYAPWISNDEMEFLNQEYNKVKPTILHEKAPDFKIFESLSNKSQLDSINAHYTVIIFWDFNCSFCRKVIEQLKKLSVKYQYLDIAYVTVYTGNETDKWKQYAKSTFPRNWFNTYQTSDQRIADWYNISLTPTLFLLNNKKAIQDKNLTVTELDSIFLKELQKTDFN
ncbi:MAG: redoxin domain-containing protein [Bacteroidales bacterium]|nr:redoxin domain-containing protein [Bacteroidales bacterium]